MGKRPTQDGHLVLGMPVDKVAININIRLDPLLLRIYPFPGCLTTSGDFCIFPFKYKGQIHNKCTKEGTKNGAYWCATSVHINQTVVQGKWEDCGKGCTLEPAMEDKGD